MPLGPWPKDKRLRESGQYNLVGISEGLTGLSIRVFTQILGWNVEEMEILLAQVRAEWRRENELYTATFRYGLSMDRNLLQRNRLDERETPYHLILRSLRSLVDLLHEHETSSLCLASQLMSTFLWGSPVYSELPWKWLLKELWRL